MTNYAERVYREDGNFVEVRFDITKSNVDILDLPSEPQEDTLELYVGETQLDREYFEILGQAVKFLNKEFSEGDVVYLSYFRQKDTYFEGPMPHAASQKYLDQADKYTYLVKKTEDDEFVSFVLEMPDLSWYCYDRTTALLDIRDEVALILERLDENNEDAPEPYTVEQLQSS